ncbi:MAG: hypothetical protein HZB67_01845 [Candidatus Aenigmarchaeota archaeon]|nr:hypothetical protein [Candidatus Aenigmarchaeota archaeon]
MKAEEHLAAFQEHKEGMFEWALEIKGLDKSQRIVGTHAARGIVELLSALLHELGKIDPGSQINHRWFKSGSSGERLPEFPKKDMIVKKLVELETLSENLTYGSQKPREEIEKTVKLFEELENIISGLMKK